MLNLPIQFNGKMRGTLEVSPGISQEDVIEQLQQSSHFAKYFDGVAIKKVIFVQDKIVNIIVE